MRDPQFAHPSHTFPRALLDPDEAMPPNVRGPSGHHDAKRFSVYRNNVVISLMEALQDSYPGIYNIMGEQGFNLIARNYVANHPPSSPMMQDFGSEFPKFLEKLPTLKNYRFLCDLAKAERAWVEAFHGPDETVLDGSALTAIDSTKLGSLTFKFRATTILIQSQYPLGDLFAFHDGEQDQIPELDNPQDLLITRPGTHVEARQLDAADTAFLASLMQGNTLETAFEAALEKDETLEPANLIALLLQSGAAKSAHLDEDTDAA